MFLRMSSRPLMLTGAVMLAASPALAQPPNQVTAGHGLDRTPKASGYRVAQEPAQSVQGGTAVIIPTEKADQVRAEKLIGMKVVNRMGEDVGTVDDIVIDKDGTVSGLVVKTGDFMGIGGKPVAVAWQDVGGAMRSNVVNIPLTREELKRAPAFKAREHQPSPNSVQQRPGAPLPLQPMNAPSR